MRESLGYRNVKTALMAIFFKNLDDILIREGEYENFAFDFFYKGYEINMGIGATGKNIQFEVGEGGLFDILFPYCIDEEMDFIFLHEVIKDEAIRNSVRRVFGKNEKDVEYAMQVLKDFLDSDEAKGLLKDR
ncbi:hypothetical protein BU202_02005 [Streptococcus cuniculi]|uniref:Uncharacterized protein n=1 Tax=Streptococcus cuniculi TaxID=1432788 RepID=A0A1Q8E9F5_9STRE|nr:hypothetical protein [Streptococcus cuniculi]OLF48415.1 hypothetical protein BU202_02005 [Streptococcus cuniculi]